MSAIRSFVRREPVLIIAAIAALLTCFFVPPDRLYLSYFDFRTLSLLYCLMTVVNGLRQAGLFSRLAHSLCERAANLRSIAVLLVSLCFFTSMLITNDVALLTFVPFAVVVMGMAHHQQELIHVVVLQTVAANLGSMLTPVGNPQNLYLYSFYDMRFGEFLQVTFPVWIASLILLLLLCLIFRRDHLDLFLGEAPDLERRPIVLHSVLFAVCLLVVLRVIPWYVMLLAVVAVLLFFDRRLLLKADFMLLLTFVAFFIFSGNLARIDRVALAIRQVMQGREYLTSLLTSQVISNVPAALLLSGFTDSSHALLLGVNVGGLGTPIASLASLISLKLYSHSEHSHTGRFLLEFLTVNFALILILSLIAVRIA
ncbi:MAG: anion permease [Oscillospiraceae bacterium]|nr:anion permease [Oscillospiraceae bacterium]